MTILESNYGNNLVMRVGNMTTVYLVIFVRFLFSQEGQICEFRNLAKIIILIALLKKNINS